MMLRLTTALVAACLLSASVGCSLCCAPFDTAFGAYGGVIERNDQYHGRVGSVFEPAGAQLASYEEMADESVVEPESAFESVEPESAFESVEPEPGFEPADGFPLDTAPLDTAPLDTAPLDTAPLNTAPLDTAPLNTAPIE